MSPAVRTVVESGLVVAFVALVCVGGWAIEKYESSRVGRPRRATRGARRNLPSRRAPRSRAEIRAAYCDLRGIRHTRQRHH